jgi:phosphoribosylaminoimidazole carboxylase PurE protein
MKVAVIMGSKSDLDVMNEAVLLLKQFNISYDVKIVSAHRTPHYMYEFCNTADDLYDVIIAGAGGSAHLPGMVAAMVNIPVIGVPIKLKTLDGMDSLLSIVQMPRGVVVLTVAINGSKNAALGAIKILAVKDSNLTDELIKYNKDIREAVLNA